MTKSKRRDLEVAWLEQCAYYTLKAELTAPSDEWKSITWYLGEVKIMQVEVSHPELEEPLGRLVDGCGLRKKFRRK